VAAGLNEVLARKGAGKNSACSKFELEEMRAMQPAETQLVTLYSCAKFHRM
jgi:hypothetical protein